MGMSTTLRVKLFGEFRLVAGDRAVPSPSMKTALLFAYLLLHSGEFVPRSKIASDLWPDATDADSRTNLRRHLLLLQRLLGGLDLPAVESSTRALRWVPTPSISIDAAEFEAIIGDRHALLSGPDAQQLALAIYQADLLERFDDEWLTPHRERYRRQFLTLLQSSFEAHAERGAIAESLALGARLLGADPMREGVAREMMSMRLASGDRAGALAEYKALTERLRDEFNVEPMPETIALYEEIRAGSKPPTAGNPSGIRLSQIPPEDKPATRSATSSFVGRARELADLRAQLRDTRLLSLIGVGGIGKSRLARALADDSADAFMDGARFVELAGLSDDASPLQAVVRTFGLAQLSPDAMQRVLTEYLRQSHILLVLDNCENHLDPCRQVVETLLEACPSVSIVTTSRLPLGLRSETIYNVGPLAIPRIHGDGPSRATSYDAVQLFLERSADAGASGTLEPTEEDAIVMICRHFDGIPLAIELAAARRRLLSARQIADRLEDPALVVDYAHRRLPAHQRSVRDAIAWTFGALDPEARLALPALSIFRTPFVFEAVEAATGRCGTAALDLLEKLVDHSLISIVQSAGEVRYKMLEPVREFAGAELDDDAARSAFVRLADYYLDLVSKLGIADESRDHRRAFESLESDRANIRAALEGCANSGAGEAVAVNLAVALVPFWQQHGHVIDGVSVHDALLAAFHARANIPLLLSASKFARLKADYPRAREYAVSALRNARDGGDGQSEGDALHVLALVDFTVGDMKSAEALHHEARRLAAGRGDRLREGRALANLGLIELQRSAHDGASRYLGQAVELLAQSGNDRLLGEATSALAYCERFRGNLGESRAFTLRAVEAAYKSGNSSLLSTGLTNLAHIAVLERDYADAVVHLRESLKLCRTGAFLFTLVHALEISARLFHGLNRPRDAAIFLYASRSLSKRLSVLRAQQEDNSLAELEAVLAAQLPAVDLTQAALMLGEASPSRCADEALARLATFRETRQTAS